MKKLHYIIYSCGVAISLILIGLFFICPENPWCVVSCSTGGSLIGAVVLGFFIDLSNAMSKAAHNKRVFEIAHVDMFSAVHSLLMVVYHPIKEYYEIVGDDSSFRYENLTVKELIEKYNSAIKEMRAFISPVTADGKSPVADPEYIKKQKMVREVIEEYRGEVLDFRQKFRTLFSSAKQQENVLLVNDSSFESDIKKAISALEILSNVRTDMAKEEELIELGKSFQELFDSGVIDIFEKIGFDNVRFKNDKGFFNITLTKEK